jgi:hypothetical protein
MNPTPRKHPPTKPSKYSKAQKFRILSQKLGIREYSESVPFPDKNLSASKRKKAERVLEFDQKRRVIEAQLFKRRTERLNVAHYMETAFRGLKSTLSHGKRFSIGWDIFYDYLAEVVHANKDSRNMLRKKLLERKSLHKIIEADTHHEPVQIGDVLFCISQIQRGELSKWNKLKQTKNQKDARTYYLEESAIQKKLIELKKIHAPLTLSPAGKKLTREQRNALNVTKIANRALEANEAVLAEITGADEAKAISGAEEVARHYMKMWTQPKRRK